MSADPPSWAQVFGRMQATGFRTAVGRMRYRVPRGKEVQEGEARFWHAAPDRWRVEDERGVWHLQDGHRILIRHGDRMEEMTPGTAMSFGDRHPRTMLGTQTDGGRHFTGMKDFSVPLQPGTETEVAGHRAWEFMLAPPKNKPYPLRISVHDRTGAVLRLAMPEADYVVEMVEFTPDVAISDDRFRWDGPVSTRHLEERERELAIRRWLDEQRLPVPRWWPAGIGYHPGSGDPQTGAFRVQLEVPGYPELVRWPLGDDLPAHWAERNQRRHVHRWSDEQWEWALSVNEPLSDEDFAKVVASIPLE